MQQKMQTSASSSSDLNTSASVKVAVRYERLVDGKCWLCKRAHMHVQKKNHALLMACMSLIQSLSGILTHKPLLQQGNCLILFGAAVNHTISPTNDQSGALTLFKFHLKPTWQCGIPTTTCLVMLCLMLQYKTHVYMTAIKRCSTIYAHIHCMTCMIQVSLDEMKLAKLTRC